MKYFLSILLLLVVPAVVIAQIDTLDNKQKNKATMDLMKMFDKAIGETNQEVNEDPDIEIDGLIFDETKTKSGRDFYSYFFQDWEAPAGASNYSIFITEKPYRLSTTMIEIKINETLVYTGLLQPRGDIVEGMSQQAVEQTYSYLLHYEEIIRQLGGDDQSGSGIF